MLQAIQFTLSPSWSDEQVMYLPFKENLDNENIFDDEYETPEEALELLRDKWKKKSWDYNDETTFTLKLVDVYTTSQAKEVSKQLSLFIEEKGIELPIVNNPSDTDKCCEFDIICFTELMRTPKMYSRPFDSSPNGDKFSCWYAEDCYKGQVYSKDFAYFDCECCHRTICEQNPSNGWVGQYRWISDCERICTKCYEEQMMSEGVDIDDMLENKKIPGLFASSSELEDAGFERVEGMDGVLVGSGYSGYQSEDVFFQKIRDRYDELKSKIVFIEYDIMAIGGMGGYVTVWAKNKIEE